VKWFDDERYLSEILVVVLCGAMWLFGSAVLLMH
jgi:hypothetical protein